MTTRFRSITCPHCRHEFELQQVFLQEIEESIRVHEKEHQEKIIQEKTSEVMDKYEKELRLVRDEVKRKDAILKEAQEIEMTLRREKNAFEEEKRSFELEKQRQLDRERNVIRQKAMEEESEKNRLKEKEKDQIIDQLKKALDDAQRKASQGSQQLQGEVQELDLEQMLKRVFPQDLIEPIGKGVIGADIRQTVRSPMGVDCGKILWESKRTKSWSDSWIRKLKDDVINDKAHIPALITEALPDSAQHGMGIIDGVWVANPRLAEVLAQLLRLRLLDVAKQKKIAENKLTKAESLYTYVTGHEFQNQVEGMIDIYLSMQEQIQRERVALERTWKQREAQVQRLLSGVAGMYGSMQGVVGSAMPTPKGLSMESINTDEDDLKLLP